MGIRTVARAWPALEWPERASYLLGAALNETHVGKQLSTRYLHAVGRRWLYFMIQGMHHVVGMVRTVRHHHRQQRRKMHLQPATRCRGLL